MPTTTALGSPIERGKGPTDTTCILDWITVTLDILCSKSALWCSAAITDSKDSPEATETLAAIRSKQFHLVSLTLQMTSKVVSNTR